MSLTSSTTSNAAAWDRFAIAYQDAHQIPTDTVTYAPGIGSEADFRLLGPVASKRILDLGCGGGQNAIALAKQGAIAIGVDQSVEQLAYARRLTEEEETRVELRHGDLAELAFQRADSVDMVIAMMSLHYVPDINRVFRQAHRILKPNGALLFSLPHPEWVRAYGPATVTSTAEPAPDEVSPRGYFDSEPLYATWEHVTFTEYHRTISALFTGLVRTSYRVDTLFERSRDPKAPLPQLLVMRARKEA